MSNFMSEHLTCDPALLHTKDSPNTTKSNRIFPGKESREEITATVYFVRIQPPSGGNGVQKLEEKWKLWVSLFSIKTQILQKNFKQCFCLVENYHSWEFWQNYTIFGGGRTQRTPEKDYFMNAESVQKILKIFNWTAAVAILMKRTTIMLLLYIDKN